MKLHSSPELREQRFLRQRVTRMRGLASSDVRSCINPCLGITTTRRMASMYLFDTCLWSVQHNIVVSVKSRC